VSDTTALGRRLTVPAVVGGVCVLGGLSLALAAVVIPSLAEPGGSAEVHLPLAILAFVVAAAVSEIVSVPLMHGDDKEDLTFFEIVTVAGILVLDPSWAVVAPLVGLAIVQIVLRIPAKKIAFNLGSYAAATVAAVSSYLAINAGAERFSLQGVIALVVAMSLFTVVNTLLLAAVLHAAEGIRIREFVADVWGLSLLMTIGSIGVGAVAVAVAPVSVWLLPFTLLPAMALWYAYRSTSQRAEERERNRWLVTLSGTLTAEHPMPELLADASTAIRSAFGAGAVLVVLPADDDLTTMFPASEGVVPVPTTRLPEGWGSAVSIGLELGEGRRGTLLLGDAADARRPWAIKQADEAVLTTVAASLGSAIRSAERHEALVEESSKLKAVVENATDGIAVLTGTGRVRLWSPAMSRITGIPEARATSTLPGVEVPSALSAIVASAVVGGVVSGQGPAEVEPRSLTITRPDGETRDVTVAVVRARTNADGEPVAILTLHDVTSQARADRLKSDFVATISHELRTPITPIKGYAQLLLARGDAMTPEKRRSAYELIADRADHLGRLVEDLLMASRASGTLGSKLATTPQGNDLRTIVSAAVESFPALAGRLELEQPETAVPVWCDSVRSVQILCNLLSNAIKYSPEGTAIGVRVPESEFGDTHAVITVTDSGCGLAAGDTERVFERFYRVEDSMTMRTSGSGLGLYIARELAIAMGGSLTVASQPGQGSTFTVRLPRTEAAAATATPSPAPASAQSVPFARTA
jgi:PAS domain S-box-containing protein